MQVSWMCGNVYRNLLPVNPKTTDQRTKNRRLKQPSPGYRNCLRSSSFLCPFFLLPIQFTFNWPLCLIQSLLFQPHGQVVVSLVLTPGAVLTFSPLKRPNSGPARTLHPVPGTPGKHPGRETASRNHKENISYRNNVRENTHSAERKAPDFTKGCHSKLYKGLFSKATRPLNIIYWVTCQSSWKMKEMGIFSALDSNMKYQSHANYSSS